MGGRPHGLFRRGETSRRVMQSPIRMAKKLNAHNVLVVNTAVWEGLSRLPYLLHQAGCHVSLMAPESSYAARSGFVDHHFIAPSDPDAALDVLHHHLETQATPYDWVIMGDDPLLYALGRRQHEAWVSRVFPAHFTPNGLAFVVSKIAFITQCHAAGVAMPDFRVCHDTAALTQAAVQLKFPLVLKSEQGFAGNAVFVVPDAQALATCPAAYPLIAQAFVPGKTGSAAAIFNHGKLVCWFSYLRERTWGALGPSTAVKFQYMPELQPMLTKLGHLSGYHGLCGVDFIQHAQTGDIVLLEQNFRPTLTMNLGKRVGVDFASALHTLLTGGAKDHGDGAIDTGTQPHPPITQKETIQTTVPLFPTDVFRAIDDKDWAGLLRWLLKASWWRELSWHDIPLLRYNLKQIALRPLRSALRTGS